MNIKIIPEYKFTMIILTKKDLKFYLLMSSILMVSIATPITFSKKNVEMQAVKDKYIESSSINATTNDINMKKNLNSGEVSFEELKIVVDAGHGDPDRRCSFK